MAEYFTSFKSYVEGNLHNGSNFEGHSSQYICSDSIGMYWTPDRVNTVLQDSLGDQASFITQRIFHERYLTPFSIIIYISDARHSFVDQIPALLNANIDDYHLPLTSRPPELAEDAWARFDVHQWKFCPLRLEFSEYNRTQDTLDSRHIFPGVEVLSESIGRPKAPRARKNDARLKYMKLGRNPMGQRQSIHADFAVIKSYPASVRASYDNETLFLSRSEQGRRPSPNVVRCLGFYSCDVKGKPMSNIILEYASKGSLLEYYGSEEHPKTLSETVRFWSSLLTFLSGLESLHQRDNGYASVHHDMQPGNLLIFPSPGDPFDFTVKLCDFGLCSTKGYLKPPAPYREGSAAYSSPSRTDADRVEYAAHPGADLFAAGCIILEAAAWAKGGQRGREEFCKRREKEIKTRAPDLIPRGLGDCFHFGRHPLQCVLDCANTLSPGDDLTSEILDLVIRKVLTESLDQMLGAGLLLSQLKNVITRCSYRDPLSESWSGAERRFTSVHERLSTAALKAETGSSLPGDGPYATNGFSSSRSENPHSTSVPRRPGMQSQRKSLPELTFHEVMEWKKSGKTIPLRGKDVAMKELNDRDHVLVIDNSDSMQPYKAFLLEHLVPLAHILKVADPDELEVMLTNDCVFRKFKTVTEIESYVSRNFRKGEESPMHVEVCFEKILDRIKDNLRGSRTREKILPVIMGRGCRKISIYFLTDGAWAEDDDGVHSDLEEMLSRLATDLHKRGMERRWVSLQFIRFGHNPHAIERLDRLDNLFSRRDFIDHKPIDSNVWHLLVGPLNRHIDKSPPSS